jgi:hypothetical protein
VSNVSQILVRMLLLSKGVRVTRAVTNNLNGVNFRLTDLQVKGLSLCRGANKFTLGLKAGTNSGFGN